MTGVVLGLIVALACAGSVAAQVPVTSSAGPAPLRAPERQAFAPAPGTGFIPPPLDLAHLRGDHFGNGRVTAQSLPTRFDWRAQAKVTSVKDQGSCGSCYAFGSIGNLESRLLIDGAGSFDLSENNAKECNWDEVNNYGGGSSCSGGNYEMVVNLLTQKGAVSESSDPYVAGDVGCNSSATPLKTVTDWRIISESSVPSTAVLKNYLYTYGPIYVTMYAGFPAFNNYDGVGTLHYTGTEWPNHAVLIVGWDDSLIYSGGTGGWIVKNSWGTDWGGMCGYGSERGYFTIAYGSANIGMYSSFAAAAQDYDPSGGLLYYDEAGAYQGAYGYGTTTAWALAKFYPTRNTGASRVEFWTNDTTTDVDVYLYDSFNGSTPSNLLWSSLNLSFSEAGYHSVAVDPVLPIQSGNDVIVVMKVTNASYVYPIGVDPVGPSQAGRTFISSSGPSGSWWDMQGDDVGIRLRTTDNLNGATPTLTPTSVSSPTPTSTPTPTPLGPDGTVVLQRGADGYTGAEDTHMFQYAANDNYSGADLLRIGYKQQYAALLRFDLSSIPYGATITQATLQIYAAGWSGGNITLGAYAVLRDASPGEATWSQAGSGSLWGLPGCNDTSTDRRASAEATVATSGLSKWYTLDLTSLVGEWTSGALANAGVLLRQTVVTTYDVRFASAEYGNADYRPMLIVSYGGGDPLPPTATPPTAPPTATPTTVSPTATGTSVPATATSTATTAAATATATTAPPTATSTSTTVPATATPTTPAGSDTIVTLQQGVDGYSGVADTYVYLYAPNDNYAWGDALKVGYRQQYAGLLRFELGSIPYGATVTQATLQVYVSGWSGKNITAGAYAVLRPWGVDQATWNVASSSSNWALPGCNDTATDRRSTPEATFLTSGIYKWYALDVTGLVQEWVNGTLGNQGVLLRQTVYDTYNMFFASAEHGTASLRPKLTITYHGAGGPSATPTTVPPSATPTATSVAPTATSTSVAPTATSTSVPPTATPTATATTVAPTPTPGGAGTTLTLQQGGNGYAGCEDTHVYLYDANNLDNYTKATFMVGYRQQNAGLMRFDLSPVPYGATVSSATLQLYGTGWSGANISVSPYVILRPVVMSQATWNQAATGNLWALAGCNDTATDRRATAESTVATSGLYKWYSLDVTGVVQQWVNGTLPNNGWLLRQSASTNASFNFASADNGTLAQRPKLVVTYR